MDLIRRARNKTKRYPKSSDPSIYSRATGFETLIKLVIFKRSSKISNSLTVLKFKRVESMKKSSKNNYSGKNNNQHNKNSFTFILKTNSSKK